MPLNKAASLLRALREERDKLRDVLQRFARVAWEGCDIDGGTFQDTMEESGLMVRVPADEAFRDEYGADEMLVLAWSELAPHSTESGDV